jgi:hypothetical protein
MEMQNHLLLMIERMLTREEEAEGRQEKAEADAKARQEKAEADAKARQEKAEADAKARQEKAVHEDTRRLSIVQTANTGADHQAERIEPKKTNINKTASYRNRRKIRQPKTGKNEHVRVGAVTAE